LNRNALCFRKPDDVIPYALLRRTEDFGMEELDLLRPPQRFWADGALAPSGAEMHVDVRRVEAVPLPGDLLQTGAPDGWHALSVRSVARLFAWFLIAEDPQRRLEAQAISTLAHQASVVQHISETPALRRVLLADEVGLGKTIEAGLLIRQFLQQNRGARVLYLAPARLVRNVWHELKRLGLNFRRWVANAERDATLDDPLVVASIHRASHEGRLREVVNSPRWDMLVVDECHHLSDWQAGGGAPVAQYKLVEQLVAKLSDDGRLILMSGTPHQGHAERFKNVLRLLRRPSESDGALPGRVIYRTKEQVHDWEGRPLFPRRQVNAPIVVDLGAEYQEWLSHVHDLFEPERVESRRAAQQRVAGWRAGQALQWATSSIQAGLGYLIRQAIRAKFVPDNLAALDRAVAAIRPYRGGSDHELVSDLFARMRAEVLGRDEDDGLDDQEDEDGSSWRPDPEALSVLLDEGVDLLESIGDLKWQKVWDEVLAQAGDEKVVLFAQPIETVTVVARFLERRTGQPPALIVGGQSDAERTEQVNRFWDPKGPRFLVSSRAGGEGLNLQVARRLVHLDVPWNPMELEQRIGRVHRFMSRRTILVDTIVVKDSRESVAYAYARRRLELIAQSLVPEDQFEALFSRVMALVPPEELQDVLAHSPGSGLTDEDRQRLNVIVTRGFHEWRSFHDRYSTQQRQIQALAPGAATWEDLAAFACEHLKAKPAEGFSALGFVWHDGEVVEASQAARVLAVDGHTFACGDYGGMPITSADGQTATRWGTNTEVVAGALRRAAFPKGPAGAAHLRWPDATERPAPGPFGLVVAARQSVRWEGGAYVESGLSLHILLVTTEGVPRELESAERGPLVRGILKSHARREGPADDALARAVRQAEFDFLQQLRRPSAEERDRRYAVTPIMVAIVS
jgi:superfamily II DNA or RNA helicase